MNAHNTDTEMIARIAADFSERLRSELPPEIMAEINRRAASQDFGCPTHDFIDANCLMAHAFAASTGREADPDSAADAELWDAAWNAARDSHFDSINLPINH